MIQCFVWGSVDTPNSHQPGAVRRGVKSYAPLGDTFSMFLTTLYTAAYIRYTILCVRGFFSLQEMKLKISEA